MSSFPSQAQFITPAHYKDAIEERSIIKVCGYPLCSNRLDNVRPLSTSVLIRNMSYFSCRNVIVLILFFLRSPTKSTKFPRRAIGYTI